MSVHYFSNKKAWVDSDIIGSILSGLERKISLENHKVVLFWDNATSHPEALQTSLTNIKFVFLHKSVTSRLQTFEDVSSEILNTDTENCLFATSLACWWGENDFSNNWVRPRIENNHLALNRLVKCIPGDHQTVL